MIRESGCLFLLKSGFWVHPSIGDRANTAILSLSKYVGGICPHKFGSGNCLWH